MSSTTDKHTIQKSITFTGCDTGRTAGGCLQMGTSSMKIVADVANMKFIEIRVDNGATSGDNRAMYLRLYLTGAGGGGEALRAFTTCENVACGTAHGAHLSLNFGATGSITGLGVAARCTLHVPNAAMSGGTYAALQAEIWNDGASSDISGVTKSSFIRVINGGDATGQAVVDDSVNFLELAGFTAGSGHMFAAQSSAAVSHVLKCDIGGTAYWIMLSNAA